ncbi:hypothetical protein Ahy_B08g089496 isoform C [Arachis hypogaea]|uniref:Uncharacterized protein n=1 Tax=Arachis hypogaea TaxID=3818 RepID=A0A444XY22_ARAHY|nr:hypothetical protein Ahy_B08g089496 isoform C [Arachis hypogaea]
MVKVEDYTLWNKKGLQENGKERTESCGSFFCCLFDIIKIIILLSDSIVRFLTSKYVMVYGHFFALGHCYNKICKTYFLSAQDNTLFFIIGISRKTRNSIGRSQTKTKYNL